LAGRGIVHDPGKPGKDGDIECLLISGQDDDISKGLVELDRRYRYWISGRLRVVCPGLGAEDLKDVYQDTMLSILLKIRTHELEPRGNVVGLLYCIAKRRAIDCLRRRQRQQVVRSAERTTVIHYWYDEPHTLNELLDIVCQFIATLPDCEQLVLRAEMEHLKRGEVAESETLWLEQILDEVHKSGHPLMTLTAVKSARQRARAKLREHLANRGYRL
jgi:DNA-directed RNA polymerase specialized sigma24 family protein